MTVTIAAAIIDAADLEAESAFWAQLLDGTVSKIPTHHFIRSDSGLVVVIQLSPEHVRPTWPEGGNQQIHFDLTTDDQAATEALILAAGGSRLQPPVYASPAGHPFCLR